jgi:hypothetical protein
VSGEGIPSGQLQKPFSYLRLALRWPSISFQLLAPLKTAAINSDKILQGTLHPIAIKAWPCLKDLKGTETILLQGMEPILSSGCIR